MNTVVSGCQTRCYIPLSLYVIDCTFRLRGESRCVLRIGARVHSEFHTGAVKMCFGKLRRQEGAGLLGLVSCVGPRMFLFEADHNGSQGRKIALFTGFFITLKAAPVGRQICNPSLVKNKK